MKVDYLNISEFAIQAGVSKQAIYKQVNNENSQLFPYVIRKGNKALVSVSALKDLYDVEYKPFTATETNQNQPIATETNQNQPIATETNHREEENQPHSQGERQLEEQETNQISTDYLTFLKAQVAELKAEKAEMERRLNATIQEKDNIINNQTEQLAQLAQQVAEIANKALITTSQQQYLTAAEKADKPEAEKKGFWAKLLGK